MLALQVAERDGGYRDSNGGRANTKGPSVSSFPTLSIDDFKVRGNSMHLFGNVKELGNLKFLDGCFQLNTHFLMSLHGTSNSYLLRLLEDLSGFVMSFFVALVCSAQRV